MKQTNLIGQQLGLHFTHNDADAVGCALVTKFIREYEFTTSFCAIDEINDIINNTIMNNDTGISFILISDISINDDVAEKLDKFCNENEIKLMLIDHHISNHLDKKYEWAKVITKDENGIPISAAKLLFNYCKDNKLFKRSTIHFNTIHILDYICEQISRYDTWEWKNHPNENGNEEDYAILVSELGCDKACDFIYQRVVEMQLSNTSLINNNTIFINYLKMIVDIYKEKRTRLTQKTYNSVVKTPICISDKLYRVALFFPDLDFANFEMENIYENNEDIDFVIGLYPKNCTVSLRARKDVDINLVDIAKCLSEHGDGGGHPKAAGAKLSYKEFLRLMDIYYTGQKQRNDD